MTHAFLSRREWSLADFLKRGAGLGFALAACLLLPALSLAQTSFNYNISTYAGTGTAGFAGDAGQATAAQLNLPCNVLADSSGNVYVSDQMNVRIRKIDSAGTITTIVGTGTSGNSGDSAAATAAQISYPCGMALDSSGNLYIADATNNVIRKVSGGNITRIAGTTAAAISGDGGLATSATLNHPMGIAVDPSGNIYIADSANNRIRKITTNGNIATVVGIGTGGYAGDGGPAVDASLSYPESVAVDAGGNIYIADTFNNRIRKVGTDGNITTIAGNGNNGFSGDGPATQVSLSYPQQIALDSAGNLFIADSLNSRIRVLSNGTLTTIAGNGVTGFAGDGGTATNAELGFPSGVAVGPGGKVYIADSDNDRIRLLTPATAPLQNPPAIKAGGVIGASAFGGIAAASPGDWIEIYGVNFAAAARQWTNADFQGANAPTALDGTKVTIGGSPAFISYISPTQVNAQVPSNVTAGSQLLTVTTTAGTSSQYILNIGPTQPGFLAPASFNVKGKQYVVALFPDLQTYVLPVGAIPGLTSRPAKPGETIVLYGVGFGDTNPPSPAGVIAPAPASIVQPLRVFFGQAPATLSYGGIAPSYVGLYQFNLVVPNVADSLTVPLTFSLGGVPGTQTLYTAVQSQQ